MPQDIFVSIPLLGHARVNSRWAPKHNDHEFDINIVDIVLTEEQQHVINNIVINSQGLYILTNALGSGRTFLVNTLPNIFIYILEYSFFQQPQEHLHSYFLGQYL
jgi:type II secretory ATPase GspE/PulE/Tfp pilus assembly ATPase PilB-like protein